MSKLKDTVRWYQTILKVAAGYPQVPVNGDHNDSKTKAALRGFQRAHGLRATGFLTVAANAGLNQIALQFIYKRFIDNRVGRGSATLRDSIREFQKDYGLAIDGKVGPATMGQMTAVLNGDPPPPALPPTRLPSKAPALRPVAGLRGEVLKTDIALGRRGHGAAPTPRIHKPAAQTNTIAEPNRWICLFNVSHTATEVVWSQRRGRITITEKMPRERFSPWALGGSGCLISPRHVLTAAHVISQFGDEMLDGWPRFRLDGSTVSVSPAHNGSFPAGAPRKLVRPYGVFESDNFKLATKYPLEVDGAVVFFRNDHDYALVDLGRPVAMTAPRYTRRFLLRGKLHKNKVELPPLGFWGEEPGFEIRATTPAALEGRDVFTIGYPVRKPDVKSRPNKRWMQWKIRGRVSSALGPPAGNRSGHHFYFKARLTSGHSGGPIWVEDRRRGKMVRTMVGIAVMVRALDVSMPDRTYSIGLALTEELLKELVKMSGNAFRYSGGRLTFGP